jgi:multidrug resistance efflux pump
MTPEWLYAVAAVVSLIGSLLVGLLAFAARAEVATLRAEMALANAKLETVRVEVRASIAEAVNQFYVRVNGNYVNSKLCGAVHAAVEDRFVKVEQSVEGMG